MGQYLNVGNDGFQAVRRDPCRMKPYKKNIFSCCGDCSRVLSRIK